MINLFQFATNDKSLEYLINIFGPMNGVITSSGGGTSLTLLGTMFKTFNSVLLAVGVLIVVYVTIVGVMKTAHEGEPMGRHWSNLWIPIRMVLGIAALVPTGSGYCAIQLVMMWVIVQGIGAADTLWNTALGYVNVAGSPYGQVTIPSVGVYSSLNGLFQALTVQETARISAQDPSNLDNGGYYCTGNNSGFCTGGFLAFSTDPSKTTYSVGPGGSSGVLTYCNQSSICAGNSGSLQCVACKAQVAALNDIIPVLTQIAAKFAQIDYDYRDFYYNSSMQSGKANWSWIYDYCSAQNIPQSQCCVRSRSPLQICKAGTPGVPGNPNFPSPNGGNYPQSPSDDAVKSLYWPYAIQPIVGGNVDFINTSVTYYTNLLGQAVSTYIIAQGQNKQALDSDLRDASSTGWIFAGAYYYTIASKNNENLAASMPALTMVVNDPNSDSSNPMNGRRNNFAAAAVLEAAAAKQGGSFSSTPQVAQLGGALDSANSTAGQTFTSTASGSGGSNPLSALQITGAVLLAVVMILFPVMMAVSFALGLAGNLSWTQLGTGLPNNPIGGGLVLLYLFMIPVLFGFMGILVTLGATLGIYVPLIPYTIFTFGVIGWFLMVIEAMVAAPLVALSMLYPSGEELLGKAQGALIYLFDVFLRPSLMIFGLIAAMLLASVVVMMINYAFWSTVLQGITAGNGAAMANPLQLVIYLSAYVALLVIALNKSFEAISVIPQGVLKWIGGHGAQYGGAEAGVGAIKGGVESGAGGVKGAATGGVKGAKDHGEGTGKYFKAKKEGGSPETVGTNKGGK